jgi:hypothetical protein
MAYLRNIVFTHVMLPDRFCIGTELHGASKNSWANCIPNFLNELHVSSPHSIIALNMEHANWFRSVISIHFCPPSSAEVKECVELYLQYAFMAWYFVKHRNNTPTDLGVLYQLIFVFVLEMECGRWR